MSRGTRQRTTCLLQRWDAGFTLVEVLLGIIIVSFVFASVYMLYNAVIRVDLRRRQVTEATSALLSAAEQLKALPWEELTDPKRFPDGTCLKGPLVVGSITVDCEVEVVEESPKSGLAQVLLTASAGGRNVAEISFLRAKEGF